ncbi:MAG: DUF5596 domain-containing protein [Clostridia bacterium]|nr:DUF5596 domain-containing protein [Clostridia bacterium]
MKERIITLMQKIAFPEESILAISDATEKLLCDGEANAVFCELLSRYEKTEHCDYLKLLTDMEALSQKVGISEYTGAMILLLAMCEKLKQRYDERGLPEEVFYNTVADLKYKNEECRLLFGIHGTFVAGWYPGFFKLERFALGRLQFEISKLSYDCECDGIQLSQDSDAIFIHIPRTGTRLDHNEVMESYRRAKEFFKNQFEGKPTAFACHSWLLYPWHEEILSPSSNLYAFYKDFKIVASGNTDKHEDAWRLFDCIFDGDASKLPRDSSLRRAYADRIASGKPTGWGMGVFILN